MLRADEVFFFQQKALVVCGCENLMDLLPSESQWNSLHLDPKQQQTEDAAVAGC